MSALGTTVGLGLVVLLFGTIAGTATAGTHPGGRLVGPAVTTVRSGWSGYVVSTGKSHSVTKITGSWIVPTLNRTDCHRAPTGSAFFAGIGMDGAFSAIGYQEAIGVWGQCAGAKGAPAYAVLATAGGTFKASPLKVAPGNVISAQIVYTSGRLNLTITNHNASKLWYYHVSKSNSNVPRMTGEWFSTWAFSHPLAPYGRLQFGPAYTHLTSTDTITIFGTSYDIGKAVGLYKSLENSAFFTGPISAVPSALSSNDSFQSTWKTF